MSNLDKPGHTLAAPPPCDLPTTPTDPVVRKGRGGRPRGPPTEQLYISLPKKEMANFLDLTEELDCSKKDAFVYLMDFDRVYRRRILRKEFGNLLGRKEQKESNVVKLELHLSPRQWVRYRSYCQESSLRSFDGESHEQRFEDLLNIAEKYAELVKGTKQSTEPSNEAWASDMADEGNDEGAIKGYHYSNSASTPKRRPNSRLLPPATPKKQAPAGDSHLLHPNAATTAKWSGVFRDALEDGVSTSRPGDLIPEQPLMDASGGYAERSRQVDPMEDSDWFDFEPIMTVNKSSGRSAAPCGTQSTIKETKETVSSKGQRTSTDGWTPVVNSAAVRGQATKPQRVTLDESWSGNDSDNSWEDGTRPTKSKARKWKSRARKPTDDDQEEAANSDDENGDRASYTVTPKDSEVPQLQLLESDYYTKFSEDARKTIPGGSKRTLAALANTRRHIVERRQLTKLISWCACTREGCCAHIDPKSIRLTETGPTVLARAVCLNKAKHQFRWTSSALIQHESKASSLLYSLNIVLPVAVHMSGNNAAKMEHFAKVLRLSWSSKTHTDRMAQVIRPVVNRCFQDTQTEMLATLSKESETSRIVLAGDGQFDSPGSCATLCTYTLMALGVETEVERQVSSDDGLGEEKRVRTLKKCGYILNQAVIDKRHADCKSGNMERVGLHWAVQPIREAGLTVSELVTDDHVQIVADFKKIAAAVEEQNSASDDNTALDSFKTSLSTALMHYKPPIDVENDAMKQLSFYGPIAHTSDIWHKAKNLLKAVSLIANTAPAKEQQTYRRYAKMIKNYLWECSSKAKGNPERFKDTWNILSEHLHQNHANCHSIDMHAKTKSMEKLDNTTKAFDKLVKCLDKVAASANQLCQFRSTSSLEVYNGLCLKYCPKRVFLTYDTLRCKRELATLDHNHHLLRAYRFGVDGKYQTVGRWKKSTKAYSLQFKKEEKDYAYIPHLMAAILHARYKLAYDLCRAKAPMSEMHPNRIQASTVPNELRETTKQTCAKYMARDPTRMRKVTKRPPQAQMRETSNSNEDVPSNSKKRKRQGASADEEWVPRKRTRATKPKCQSLLEEEEPTSPKPTRKERRTRASPKKTPIEKNATCESPISALGPLDTTDLGSHMSDAIDTGDDGGQCDQNVKEPSAGVSTGVIVQNSSIEASITTSDNTNSNTVSIAASLVLISDEAASSHHHQDVLEEPPHSGTSTDTMNAQGNDPNPGGSFWMEDDTDLLFSIGQAVADPCVSQTLGDPSE